MDEDDYTPNLRWRIETDGREVSDKVGLAPIDGSYNEYEFEDGTTVRVHIEDGEIEYPPLHRVLITKTKRVIERAVSIVR